MNVNGYEIKPDANLEGANLKYDNLVNADLKYANLEGANLEGANLEGANLEDANLEDANVTGTILEKKEDKDLKIQQLEEEVKKYKEKFNQLNALLNAGN